MINTNSHFGTLRYTLIMYTFLFTYVAHYLNNKQIKLVLAVIILCPEPRFSMENLNKGYCLIDRSFNPKRSGGGGGPKPPTAMSFPYFAKTLKVGS